MSRKKRAINAIVSCFADENPSWQSISIITTNNARYKAIVEKLQLSFGADDRKSELYIDEQSHQHMFYILLNCMDELDSCVKNHSYDRGKRDTKNIKFVRDIVKREFNIDGLPDKFDQRQILFETACVVLLSMNNNILGRISETTFPKYQNLQEFLDQPCYDDFKNLTFGENNEHYYFANYINVALNFLRGSGNQKHIIQIGLRIVAGRGERFITGKGITDKNKRRIRILEAEANEDTVVKTFKDSFKPYFEGNNDFERFVNEFEAQIGVELPNLKTKEHSRNIAGVDIKTNVYEKSTSDEKINVTIHETSADGTTLSRSASLVERFDNDDDDFIRDIEAMMQGLDLEELNNGTSITTNLSKSKNYLVKTTTVNIRNSLGERNTSLDAEFPTLLRSTSQSTEEYDLIRSTSNANDLLINHLNMASLTDELISFNSLRDIFSFDFQNTAMDPDLVTKEILQNDVDSD